MFIAMSLFLETFPCPVKFLVPHLHIVFTPDKETDFSVMPTLYPIGFCSVSRTYPIVQSLYLVRYKIKRKIM